MHIWSVGCCSVVKDVFSMFKHMGWVKPKKKKIYTQVGGQPELQDTVSKKIIFLIHTLSGRNIRVAW